jgi:sirohydrochlorin cobaltochelatase
MPVIIEHIALIVAHGAPSTPEGPEAVLRELGVAVEALLPSCWAVRGTTLAAPGALAAAVEELPAAGRLLVYPHFMADGWFTTEELPRRLRGAGAEDAVILLPFGLDPVVLELCERRAAEAAQAEGYARGEAGVLLAAHGSPDDPRPAAVARAAARHLARSGAFREVRTGFIDQAPYLSDAARIETPALCLPFFAGHAGHMEVDVPQALAEARFSGPVLVPVGSDAEVPGIIAAALMKNRT